MTDKVEFTQPFERWASGLPPVRPLGGVQPTRSTVDMFHNPRYIVVHAPGEYCHGMWYEVAELPIVAPARLGVHSVRFEPTGRYETRDDGCWAEIYEATAADDPIVSPS